MSRDTVSYKSMAPISLPMKILPLLFLLTTTARLVAQQTSFDHSHAALTDVLRDEVKNERVNYAALKRKPAALDTYLDTLAAVPEKVFKGWGKNERLAFLINLYNATTIKLVVDRYPVSSIKDIGGFFSSPWKQKVVRAFGKTFTLDQVEHEMIRPNYGEPRAHFGLVCASIGCPPLRAEAFDAARLSDQLDDQGRVFFATKSKNRVDGKAGVLYLSSIFKWFKEDFTGKSGSVEKFVAPFFNDADKAVILSGKLSIEYTDYDWSLNKQ